MACRSLPRLSFFQRFFLLPKGRDFILGHPDFLAHLTELFLTLCTHLFILGAFFHFLIQKCQTIFPFSQQTAISCFFVFFETFIQKRYCSFVPVYIAAKSIYIINLCIDAVGHGHRQLILRKIHTHGKGIPVHFKKLFSDIFRKIQAGQTCFLIVQCKSILFILCTKETLHFIRFIIMRKNHISAVISSLPGLVQTALITGELLFG